MRKKDIIVLIIVIGITAVLSIFVVFASKKAEKVTKAENLAYEELTVSMENQKNFFISMLDEKFSALESLSYYLGIVDELDFPAEREYSDAVMLANHFDAIYLSDLEGNAVAYDGSRAGSIADQQLYRETYMRKVMRAVQYSDNTGRDGEPVILIAVEALGYTEDELNRICEKDISKIIHPDDLAETVEANLKNANVGDSFQLTVRYRKKDGEYVWINVYSHIFRLEDGTAVCASQFVDITRQKELEQQLRAREEEYKIAASMSRYVIMRYEIRSRTLAILARGTSAQQLDNVLCDVPEQAIRIGFVAPESIETARKVFADIDRGVSRKGKTVLALDTGSGSRLWAEMSYSVVYGSKDETPVAAILSFIDVTEKRRAEEFMNIGSALMDYATNAKLIIANLSTGLIEFEAPGTIHRCFTEITGTNDIYKML